MIRAAALVLVLLVLASPVAHAQTDRSREEARQLLDDGVRLYRGGQLEAALDRFQKAYELLPSAALLLNIGTTQRKLGKGADAANTYQRYLDDPAADASKIAEVEGVLAELDGQLGLLLLATSKPDAEIQVGSSPWRPARDVRLVRVGPGAQAIRARNGELVVEVTVVVEAGERREVELAAPRPPAAPLAPPVAAVASAPRPPPPRRTRSPRRWVALGAGATGALVGAVGGALALRATRRFADARATCPDPGCPPGSDYDRALAFSEGGRGDRRWSALLIGAGVVAIAGGTTLWLTAPSRRAPERLSVSLDPGRVGVSVTARF
jgi:tetratricopeptide (TPR) repeat protein